MNRLPRVLATVLSAFLAVTGCQGKSTGAPATPSALPPPGGYSKVLVIAEENHEYDRIIGAPDAPYLNELARTYGTADHFDAGYPAQCPSLAAYILMTSGSTAGICDDRAPQAHPLPGDNVFHQVAASGREWRNYAESAPGPCALDNGADGRYLVRHVPATYYLDERSHCADWVVPVGDPRAGALHDDIRGGRLPSFAFVSPDACHDMHGANPCPSDRVGNGDRWLHQWLPPILAGPDYRAGRLIVIVTWDEGTSADNHIPTLVISPTTNSVQTTAAFTHCSTLRTTEDVLGLPPLDCARQAPSMVAAFHL